MQLFKDWKTGDDVLADIDNTVFCPFQFIQTIASDTWTVVHNKNTKNIIPQVYVGNLLVKPKDIIIIDETTFIIKFTTPMTGFVNVGVYTTKSYCQ